jgi:hypothetical protein
LFGKQLASHEEDAQKVGVFAGIPMLGPATRLLDRATGLKAALLLRGDQRVVIINVPWYLKDAAS